MRHGWALEGLPSHPPWPSLQGLLPVSWPSSQISCPCSSSTRLYWFGAGTLEAPGGFTLFAATFAAEFPAEAVAIAEVVRTGGSSSSSESPTHSIRCTPKPKPAGGGDGLDSGRHLSFTATLLSSHGRLAIRFRTHISALHCISPLSRLR